MLKNSSYRPAVILNDFYLYLETVESSLAACRFVREHSADHVLEHLGRRSAVEGTSGRFSQVTFSQVFQNLNQNVKSNAA